MKVETVHLPIQLSSSMRPESMMENTSGSSFNELLSKALQDISDMQLKADQLNNELITGQLDNIHEAVIAMEKASISLQMALLFRNKIIEAYQEMMKVTI